MIFRPSPLRLAPNGGSLCRGREGTGPVPGATSPRGGSVLVPIHAKTVQFLIHNITFCLFVNRFFPEKGAKDGFSIRIPHVMSNSTLLHMKKERPKGVPF